MRHKNIYIDNIFVRIDKKIQVHRYTRREKLYCTSYEFCKEQLHSRQQTIILYSKYLCRYMCKK